MYLIIILSLLLVAIVAFVVIYCLVTRKKAAFDGNATVTGSANVQGDTSIQGNLNVAGKVKVGTGKSISWLDYGTTPGTLNLQPGMAGSYQITFSTLPPAGGSIVMFGNPVSGVNIGNLSCAFYNYTKTGCTMAINNASSSAVTNITYQWVALVIG